MKIRNDGIVSGLLRDIPIPRMFRASQTFPRDNIPVDKIPDAIRSELSKPEIVSRIKPGMQIAITAGSRGVRNVALITKTIVDFVKEQGAIPFIVPAMGSHGGATAEGQTQMLAGFGITPEAMGCEIRSSMEVVHLGLSERGKDVYMDRNAYEADGIIVSCRVKPHNSFRGPIESGICKMMAVGLGKQAGASLVHNEGVDVMTWNVQAMAKVIIAKAPVLFGIPCIENAYDETCYFEAVPAENILEREPELLKMAFANMPSILVEEADVLIVDNVGKNFSGSGVDPNITGEFSTPYVTGGLKAQRRCYLNLTPESHGNALGSGLASAITKKIYDEIDPEMMYPNCITSTVIKSAMIPVVLYSDKEAIQFCIRTCNKIDQANPRIVRIKNSLHIGEIMLSESYYEDVKNGRYQNVAALDEPADLEFDPEGELLTKI
jgi:hypothetical protein